MRQEYLNAGFFLAPLVLLGGLACRKPAAAAATPRPATRPPAAEVESQPSLEERLQAECPLEQRSDCVATMLELLRPRSDLGRVALCIDRAGNWLPRWEKDNAPSQALPPQARTGDRCPDAFPYAIRGLYPEGAAGAAR